MVKADLIHMLLFTGCRRGEIVFLKWQDVGEATLALSDSKTGARQIWLREAERIGQAINNMMEENFEG